MMRLPSSIPKAARSCESSFESSSSALVFAAVVASVTMSLAAYIQEGMSRRLIAERKSDCRLVRLTSSVASPRARPM